MLKNLTQIIISKNNKIKTAIQEKYFDKLWAICKKYNVDKALCTPIIVSKNKTHWFFGARFINHKTTYHLAIV